MIPKPWHKAARCRIPRHLRDTYFALASHCFGDKRQCCPSQRRLARLIDAAPSTINDHISKLAGWNVITRHHHGRHCEYELHDPAEWQVPRRNPKVSADCSETRTEKRITYGASLRQRATNHKTVEISQHCAERRAKRCNLIKTARRWVQLSPDLPESERVHRLSMLDRAESMLDDWWHRTCED